MMKKTITLLTVVLGFIAFGQKYEAEITFNDNTTKNVLLDPLAKINHKNLELNYKENKDSKTQKISLLNLKKIVYTDNDEKVTAVPISTQLGVMWMYIVYEGKIIVYTNSTVESESHWTNGSLFTHTTELSAYAFKYKDEPAQLVSSFMDAGPLTINTFQKKANEKSLISYFEKKCPKLVEAYKNKVFKMKKNPYPFVEYFEKNCD